MPRILVITHTPPWPTNNGGHQRTNLLLRALQNCGDVDLFLLPRSPARHPDDLIEHLRREFRLVDVADPIPRGRHGMWRWIRPLSPKWVDRLAGVFGNVAVDYAPDASIVAQLKKRLAATNYDLIVGRYLWPTARSGALDHQPLILDVDDIDTDRCRTQLAAPGQSFLARLILKRRLSVLEEIVPAYLDDPDHLWSCSETDRQELGPDRCTVLPNIPFFAADSTPFESETNNRDPGRILFVGSLSFGVNVRGVEHFLQHAWPAIRAFHPTATFRIVGTGLPKAQEERWRKTPGVELAGRVEDLAAEYAQCAFTAVPVFEGGGTKIKVLESLAFGRSCVVASHSHRGFEHALKDEESLLVADDLTQFSAHCCNLLAKDQLRDQLASTGREKVLEHFSFSRFAEIVETTVSNVLQENDMGEQRLKRQQGQDLV